MKNFLALTSLLSSVVFTLTGHGNIEAHPFSRYHHHNHCHHHCRHHQWQPYYDVEEEPAVVVKRRQSGEERVQVGDRGARYTDCIVIYPYKKSPEETHSETSPKYCPNCKTKLPS